MAQNHCRWLISGFGTDADWDACAGLGDSTMRRDGLRSLCRHLLVVPFMVSCLCLHLLLSRLSTNPSHNSHFFSLIFGQ